MYYRPRSMVWVERKGEHDNYDLTNDTDDKPNAMANDWWASLVECTRSSGAFAGLLFVISGTLLLKSPLGTFRQDFREAEFKSCARSLLPSS